MCINKYIICVYIHRCVYLILFYIYIYIFLFLHIYIYIYICIFILYNIRYIFSIYSEFHLHQTSILLKHSRSLQLAISRSPLHGSKAYQPLLMFFLLVFILGRGVLHRKHLTQMSFGPLQRCFTVMM